MSPVPRPELEREVSARVYPLGARVLVRPKGDGEPFLARVARRKVDDYTLEREDGAGRYYGTAAELSEPARVITGAG